MGTTMVNRILKQSIARHFYVSGFIWSMIPVLFGIWWYFNFDRSALIIAAIYYAVLTIPALYLHISYSIKNRGEEIAISSDDITVKKNGIEHTYNKSELEEISIYKSASLDKWGIPFSAMEYYYYVRILTKSGEEVIITCLMGRDIDEEVKKLSGIPIERHKGFFCALWWK